MVCYACKVKPTKYRKPKDMINDAYHTYIILDSAPEQKLEYTVARHGEYCKNFIAVGKVDSIDDCGMKVKIMDLMYFTIGSPKTCYLCASTPTGYKSNTKRTTNDYNTYILEDLSN